MKVIVVALKEIRHRTFNFLLGVFSVMVAVGAVVGSLNMLISYDIRTEKFLEHKQAELKQRLDRLQDDTRKSMLKLGFNIVILPEDQNLAEWYTDDYASKTMPESFVDTLANSGMITVRHFLPSLQQKVLWPEKKRTIILVGTRGEVPNLHKRPRAPMVEPVEPGTMVLGHELHHSLGIEQGDRVTFMGRDFRVDTCYAERGNKDDITAWIHLKEAQELLDKNGRINAILALECVCTGENVLPRIRREIAEILPDTQVIERGSRAIARAEARLQVAQEARAAVQKEIQARTELKRDRERLVSVLMPSVMLACAVWILVLGLTNVRSRRAEIGILRAIGVSVRRILALFLYRHVLFGLLGGVAGFGAGLLGAALTGAGDFSLLWTTRSAGMWALWLLLSVSGAVFFALVAGWVPTMLAANQDPAQVLRDEG